MPALGKPTSATSATVLSSRTTSAASPGSPSSAKPGALRRAEASAALPRPPRPPCGDDVAGAGADQVGEHLAVGASCTTVPSGTGSTRSSPSAPLRLPPWPGLPLRGLAVRAVVVVEQRGGVRVDDEDDVAAAAAVAAVGAAERLELLAVDGGAAVAAVAGGDVQHDAVDERGHGASSVVLGCWSDRSTVQPCRDRRQGGPVTGPPLARSAAGQLAVGRLGGRDDVDDAAAAPGAELDRAGDEREQRVVAAAADVVTGVEVGAALADDDLAGVDDLAAEALDAEALRVGVATVAGGGRALLVCHGSAFHCLRRTGARLHFEPVSMPVTLTCVSCWR